MKKWKVVRTKKFKEQLETVPPEDRLEIEKAIEEIAKNPYKGKPVTCKKCGSNKISLEEGIFACMTCGVRWTYEIDKEWEVS